MVASAALSFLVHLMFDPSNPPGSSTRAQVQEVNDCINKLIARRVPKIAREEPSGFRLSNMIRAYTQVQLRRSLVFLEAALDEQKKQRGLVTLSNIRNVYETIAVYYEFERKLMPLLDAGDLDAVVEFVHRSAFAARKAELVARAGTETVRPTNVVTLVEKMARVHSSYFDDYEHLCEFAHPNALGGVVYFQRFDDPDAYWFRDDGQAPEEDIVWVLRGAALLTLLEDAIQRVEARLTELSAKAAERGRP
jgi:hypothetical protein